MSKSLGNFPLSAEVQQHGGTCPSCQAALDLDELRRGLRFPGLEEADERVAAIYDALARARAFVEGVGPAPPSGDPSAAIAGMLSRFRAAIADDLNTAAAIAALSEPLRELNRLLSAKKKEVDAGLRYASVAPLPRRLLCGQRAARDLRRGAGALPRGAPRSEGRPPPPRYRAGR
jgi:cysteinyl-tRNA synthetase